MEKIKGKTKTVHVTAQPYPRPTWPLISVEVEQTILALLIPLLKPVSDHRRCRRHSSKANRGHTPGKEENTSTSDPSGDSVGRHEVHDYLTLGFNSIVRRLEHFSRTLTQQIGSQDEQGTTSTQEYDSKFRLAAVFVCSAMPEMMIASLPLSIATSSRKSHQGSNSIRLILLSEATFEILADSLHQPRLGVLGLQEGAPGANGLIEFIRENVKEVETPWLQPNSSPKYLPVNIQTSQTQPFSQKRSKKRRKSDKGFSTTQ